MPPKPKITGEVEKELLSLIQSGVAKKRAAEAVGVNETTFYRMVARSASFASAVEKAYAKCVSAKVLRVQKAEDHSWQAAAWWLERRENEDWGRRERVEQTGKDGGPIQFEHSGEIDVKAMTVEQLHALKALLAAAPRLEPARTPARNGTREKEPA